MINFVAIDIETATHERSSICQIGITEVVAGKPLAPKSWLVKPANNEYNEINIYKHGITPKVTENSPSFPQVWEEIKPYIQDRIVVCHNYTFDISSLRKALDKHGIEKPAFQYYCTLNISKQIFKGLKNYQLTTVLSHLDLNIEKHHDAGCDSLGCAQIFIKCLEKENYSITNLENNYHIYRGIFPNEIHQSSTKKTQRISLSELVGDPDQIDEDSYFYGKNICFTGTCKWKRADLLQKIKDIGGIPSNTVNKSTEILVVGQLDYEKMGESKMTGKLSTAMKLLEQGQDIEIISEVDFWERL